MFEPVIGGQLAELYHLRRLQRVCAASPGEECLTWSVIGGEFLQVGDLRDPIAQGRACDRSEEIDIRKGL